MEEHLPEPERSYKKLCKSVRFLDEKLNEVMAEFKANKKSNDLIFKDFADRLDGLSEFMEFAKSEDSANKKHLKALDDTLVELPTKEGLSKHVEKALKPFEKAISGVEGHLQELLRMSLKTPQEFAHLDRRLAASEHDAREMKSSLHADRLKMNVFRSELDDGGRERLMLARSVDEGLRKFDSLMNDRFERLQKVIEDVDSMGKALKSKIQRDSLNLSGGLDSKFQDLKLEYSQELESSRSERKEVINELGRIEHEMLKALQSGKTGKEMADFIKQVGYNAQQIARIEQFLQGSE